MARAITDDKFHVEQELRDLYYDPEHGYRSIEGLYKVAKEKGLDVSRREVGDWLKEQSTYTKFKPLKRPNKYQRVFVKNLGDQLQMDLVDMQKLKSQNDDHYWILTAIEVLSRYAFAVPVLRKYVRNMTNAVSEVLEEFGRHFGELPKRVQFDEGNEFYNVGVKELLEDHKIEYFSSHTGRKASIVERFNRTLKTRMWKYFDAEKTGVWLDVLEKFVDGYNGSVNRSIKMKPKDVNSQNAGVVFVTLYGYGNTDFPEPKFKVDDRVRIYRYKNTFAKGFKASFTDEVFTVVGISLGDPNMYRVSEGPEEPPIKGRFYESEMSLYTGRE